MASGSRSRPRPTLDQVMKAGNETEQTLRMLKEAHIYLLDDAGNIDGKIYLDAADNLKINNDDGYVNLEMNNSANLSCRDTFTFFPKELKVYSNKIYDIKFLGMDTHSTGYSYDDNSYGWNSDYDLPVGYSATYGERPLTQIGQYYDDDYLVLEDDFLGNNIVARWALSTSDTGAGAMQDAVNGVYQITNGANATGSAVFSTAKDEFTLNKELRAKIRVKLNNTSNIDFRFGLMQASIHYSMLIVDDTGDVLLRNTDGGGGSNEVDSGVDIGGGTWRVFELVYDEANTQWVLYMDGSQIATNGTNNPGATTGYVRTYISALSNVQRTADIDYIKALQARQ